MRNIMKRPAMWAGLVLSLGAAPAMAGGCGVNMPMTNCQAPSMQPVMQTVMRPVAQTVMKPVMQSVMKPVTQTVMRPVMQPVMKPVVQTVMRPVAQPVMRPVMPAPCQPAQNCQRPVSVRTSVPVIDPITVQSEQPLGWMSSVKVNGAPNMTVTRVYDSGPSLSLSDVPTAFTGGCQPESSQYCSQAQAGQPAMPPQIMPRPMPRPAYAPMAMPAPMSAPAMPSADMPGAVTPTAGDGTYWERVSGPTTVGGLPATQILCKRQAPTLARRTVMNQVKVIRPVVNVGVPVPTPVLANACAGRPVMGRY